MELCRVAEYILYKTSDPDQVYFFNILITPKKKVPWQKVLKNIIYFNADKKSVSVTSVFLIMSIAPLAWITVLERQLIKIASIS